ncbi:MAG: biotin--[acetyl-CoA-carboxylase] ligase [Planctomycetota bacterium]|jgi:BirA family biotin operon repressor/biotin-[acetyl-CoA-carboxylase] ligase
MFKHPPEPVWYEEVDSTNTLIYDKCKSGEVLENGFNIAAMKQTAGRGRSGRSWISREGKSLCFSILIKSETADKQQFASLPMYLALSVRDLLLGYGLEVEVKWPNDVMVGDKKICGILSEEAPEKNRAITSFIVGVGININLTREELLIIDRPCTSLLNETGVEHDIAEILNRLLWILPGRLTFWETGGFPEIITEFIAASGGTGKEISVHREEEILTGIISGYGENGELLLTVDNGETISVWSGEVFEL